MEDKLPELTNAPGCEPGRNIMDSWYPEKSLTASKLSRTGYTFTGNPLVHALFFLHGRVWREEMMFGIYPYHCLYEARFQCTYYQTFGRLMAIYTCFDHDFYLGPDNIPIKHDVEAA